MVKAKKLREKLGSKGRRALDTLVKAGCDEEFLAREFLELARDCSKDGGRGLWEEINFCKGECQKHR